MLTRTLCSLSRRVVVKAPKYTIRYQSNWAKVPQGPPDPILGITVAFKNDTSDKKINLGVGAYRDDKGKPYILSCVRKAEEKIFKSNLDHEYAPIDGLPEFNKVSSQLLFGEQAKELSEKRVASTQALSGTGALRLAAQYLRRFLTNEDVYTPDPTWPNHKNVFADSGFKNKSYRYYNGKGGLDFEGMKEDMLNMPAKSIVVFHTCAHNPTGVDPTPEQWKELSKVCKQKDHVLLFDTAYQGFASGDPVRDVFGLRAFLDDGHLPVVCQSFAKNFGLYGERIGGFHVVTASAEETERVMSQLKILIRPMYSNPPVHGARIVSTILGDKELAQEWSKEVKVMADRIISMRLQLVSQLKALGSKHDWSHITSQIGMFCYSGLKQDQVEQLQKKWHVYMTKDGRISMAGVSSDKVAYLAEAIHDVTK